MFYVFARRCFAALFAATTRGDAALFSRAALASLAAFAASCTDERARTDAQVTYRSDIAPLLEARCATCHEGPAAAAGWRVGNYGEVIACTSAGVPATVGGDTAPILAVFERGDHAGLLDAAERERLRRWLSEGAPSTRAGVHPATFADPRAPDGHAQFLRARNYRPLTDPADADACGHCHEGAPRDALAATAPGATPCTTCHTDEGGVASCGTCHGAPGRSYPPRDPCFFPEAADRAGAHARHAGPAPTHAEGLPCSTCHPTPGKDEVFRSGTTHLDTHVEIYFDHERAGRAASFDAATKRCTGTCHARGGTQPEVSWYSDVGMNATCTSCHGAPPPDHYAGACTSCHREANASGTSLEAPILHVDGKVDLGDGSGRCGACHGRGDDPWPTTGAHAAHASPGSARAVPCASCHVVPSPSAKHPVGGGAKVSFGGLAIRGGARATFDVATKACAGTYCHTGRGGEIPTPRWAADPASRACGACHSAPPPPPHSQSADCSSASGCHQGSLASPSVFTPGGKAAHVDGEISRGVIP